MTSDLDAILRRVASGELSPEAALPLIDAAKATSESAPESAPATESTPADPAGTPEWGTPSGHDAAPGRGTEPGAGIPGAGRPGAVQKVRVAASYRSIEIIADPTVHEVAVVGLHSVRRDGDTLVIESLQLPGFQGLTGFGPGAGADGSDDGTERGGKFSFASLPRSIAWARAMKDQHLTVRVNPALPIDVDAAAAAVRIDGCEVGARIRLVASSLKVDRLRGPLALEALSSSVKGFAQITGSGRISCESSSVKLQLQPGSDVRLTATNRMGKVLLVDASRGTSVDLQSGGAVVGDGEGQFAIDAVMSSVILTHAAGSRRTVGVGR